MGHDTPNCGHACKTRHKSESRTPDHDVSRSILYHWATKSELILNATVQNFIVLFSSISVPEDKKKIIDSEKYAYTDEDHPSTPTENFSLIYLFFFFLIEW